MFHTTARRLQILLLVLGLHGTPFGSINAHASVNVSLQMLNGNLPVVWVSVNRRAPVEFVIDTGTNTTLIDPRLVLRLQLQSVGTKTLTTLSGPATTRRFILDTIAVANASRSRVEALEQPMTELQRFDRDIQGIIGWDFLRDFSFRIDYQRSRLELYTDATDISHENTGGVRVPLRITGDHIIVPMASTDAPHGVWRLALDSGISQLLIFENRLGPPESTGPHMSNRLGAAASAFAAHDTSLVTTNFSSASAMTTTLAELSIGDLILSHVPAVILPTPPTALATFEDGLLPACIFRAIAVDRANSLLILDPD